MKAREKVNILLVDDQPGKLLSLEAILAVLDENVVKANSADEALKLLLGTEFAVVLVDVCMPRMDGFELAELIRGHPRFRRTAIIFISAVNLTDADRLKGYDLGAVDYIHVPIIPEILRAKVALFADLYRKTNELEGLNRELERRVAERTADLESSIERLHLAAEAANFGVYDLDAVTGELHWSPKLREICGLAGEGPVSREQIAGIVHPEDLEEYTRVMEGALSPQGGDDFETEYRIIRPDGRTCWMLDKGRAIFVEEEGGRRPVRVLGTVLDVTERTKAQEVKAALAAIVESSQDAIIGKTLDGIVTTWNAGAAALFGYTAEEMVGGPVTPIIPPELIAQDEQVMERVRRGEHVDPYETVRVAKDGRRIDVSLTMSPLRDARGRIVGASKVSRDITERKRAEAVLARDRATLEKLVTERTAELREASERLRLADRMATIGTLSAGLGHDMGNLLLPVRMRLDTIERHPLPEEVRADLSAIRTATQYLQRLARSLRLLAIDSQEEPTDRATTVLGSWWREVDSVMRNGLPRSVQLRAAVPPGQVAVRIGEAALTQIVFNLVQNAGHAVAARPDGGGGPGGGEGRVEVVASVEGDRVRLVITDNGVGMSEEVQRRCLEPFFTTRTRELGTGLGMTLVTGLLRRAGGSLEIQSEPGKGTAVSILLPICPGATEAEPAGKGAEADRGAGDARSATADPGGQRAGAGRAVAMVALKDRRLLAHVNSVLTSLAIDIRNAGRPEDADIWITDVVTDGAMDAVRRFAAQGPQRRAIIMCDACIAAGLGVADGAVVSIDPALRPSLLRSRIQDVLTGGQNPGPAAGSPMRRGAEPPAAIVVATRASAGALIHCGQPAALNGNDTPGDSGGAGGVAGAGGRS